MNDNDGHNRRTGSLAAGYALAVIAAICSVAAWSLFMGSHDGPPLVGGGVGVPFVLFALVVLLIVVEVRYLAKHARLERTAGAEVERQLRQTDRLQQLTATLSRARTPSEAIRTFLPDLLYAVEATAGAVFLLADDGRELSLAHAVGYADAGSRIGTADEPLVADSIRRRELVVAAQAQTENGPQSLLRAGDIIVPLVVAGRGLGAVVVTLAQPDPDEGIREFLLGVGRYTAQALDRARLYEMAERARADAEALRVRADVELRERQKAEAALRLSESRYRALAARTSRLYALSAGLSEAVNLDAVYTVVLHQGPIVAGAAAGSVAMLVDGLTQFEMAAVESRRPVFVGSFEEWQEKYPRSALTAADGGYASAAALPLFADGAAFGVLSLYFTAPVNFDEEYAALLTSVAQHCAQALDRARLYESAERARAEAEAANRSKDDFLSTISHELRTPLNAMLGWAAMLRNGAVDASRSRRAVDAIFNNATRQGRLIEELLDVSRIVAGRASIDRQDVDLSENIRGAVEAMMPQAAAKGVELAFSPAPQVHVHADPRRLEQVFLNLLSNAVKFTPQGQRVAVDVAEADGSVRVRVADTGAGITPDFLPHVFDRFRQGDSATTRSAGGLGLGLFIARQLVEAQSGRIEVESAGANKGATFTVTLPAFARGDIPRSDAGVDPPSVVREAVPVLDGIRVLLVDDEPDAREMMASALEVCGATVVCAESAADALETLGRTEFDLLLSDIAMPGRDGYELIRAVRSLPSRRTAAIPAAAVTAHARDDERARVLAAGFQMHLAKPIHPSVLARAVATLAFGSGHIGHGEVSHRGKVEAC